MEAIQPDTMQQVHQPIAKLKRPPGRIAFEQSFAALRPYLYHLTAASNVGRICRMRRLDCAATLLRLGGCADLVRKRRATRTGRTVRVDNEEVHVRDQAPLHRGNMVLLGGWGFEDFIEHLNSFVFFWPGTNQGTSAYGVRHFCRNAREQPALIRVPTADTLAKNCSASPRFCSYNSGAPRCTKGRGSPRGPNTFAYGERFDRRPSGVVEVVYSAGALLPATAELSSSLQGPWRSLY